MVARFNTTEAYYLATRVDLRPPVLVTPLNWPTQKTTILQTVDLLCLYVLKIK